MTRTVKHIERADLPDYEGYILHMTYPDGITHSGVLSKVEVRSTYLTSLPPKLKTDYNFQLGARTTYTIDSGIEVSLSVESPENHLPTAQNSLIYVLKAKHTAAPLPPYPTNQPYIRRGIAWHPFDTRFPVLEPTDILDFEPAQLKPQVRKAP